MVEAAAGVERETGRRCLGSGDVVPVDVVGVGRREGDALGAVERGVRVRAPQPLVVAGNAARTTGISTRPSARARAPGSASGGGWIAPVAGRAAVSGPTTTVTSASSGTSQPSSTTVPGDGRVARDVGHLERLDELDALDLEHGGLQLGPVHAAAERPAPAVGPERRQRRQVLAQHQLDPAAHGDRAVAGLHRQPRPTPRSVR